MKKKHIFKISFKFRGGCHFKAIFGHSWSLRGLLTFVSLWLQVLPTFISGKY